MKYKQTNDNFKISKETMEIAGLIIEELIDSGYISKENFEVATEIAAEELEVQNGIRKIGKL